MASVVDELMELWRNDAEKANTEALGEETDILPLCSPQISHRLA